MTQAADRLRNVDGVDVEPNKMYFSTNIDAALLARTRLSGDAGELDRIVEHTKLRSARADFVHRYPDLLTKSSSLAPKNFRGFRAAASLPFPALPESATPSASKCPRHPLNVSSLPNSCSND